VAIAELCQLAGQSQRIASFLANGTSEIDVRKALLASRAEGQEIQSHIHHDAVSNNDIHRSQPADESGEKTHR